MTEIETQITEVAVYIDRARVTRQGKPAAGEPLEKGLHTFIVAELPLVLIPNSVRAAARGSATARLLGVQVQRAFFTQTPAESVRKLEEQIEALEDELAALDARTGWMKEQRLALKALLDQADTFAMALASGEWNVEAQARLFASLAEQAAELDADLQQAAGERRGVERRLARLKSELDQQRSARPLERYTAAVEVEVLEPGSLTIQLTYMVGGAAWKPLYDVRLAEAAGEGEQPSVAFTYLAEVTQKTGEAWQDATLSLSTARPALAGRLPELKPWYLAPVQPRPALAAQPEAMPAPMRKQGVALMASTRGGEAVRDEPAPPAQAEVSASGAAVTYRIPATVHIPSDGAPHKVTVAQFSLPAQLDYVTAPKLVEAAHRRARLTNASPYLLLPGPANLFAGDEYIGAAPLELAPPESEIEFYLGVDDRLKVARELTRREMEKTLIGGKRRVHYGYKIDVENLLPQAASLTLHDQLPVGRHEDIKVKFENSDPRPTKQDDLNLLSWELDLAPKEKRTLRFSFSVEFPQGMEVAGLP